MSYSAADEVKEQIRNAIDIVDLVGGYVPLRRQGRHYVALCPFHDDTKPSLQINQERQSWKCWVCDVGGDIFSFLMQREGLSFPEALAMLAERAGVELRPGRGPKSGAATSQKQRLFQILSWAEQQFHRCLLESSSATAARTYLQERGVTEESWRRFHLGFSPDSWQWLIDQARSSGHDLDLLEQAGLTSQSQSGRPYDRFRGRVIFPIRDVQDRAIAFGGRVLPGSDDRAKYVNSPETRLFSKSNELYALNLARDVVSKQRHVVVVEGYTDVIVAHQSGVQNVVAVLGTALGEGHIRVLRRFVDSVTLVLDGDEAGQRRTSEVLELFVSSPLDLRIGTLPGGLDPCDFVLQQGPERFQEFVRQAVDALEHKIRISTANIDLRRDLHKANQALESILQTMARTPESDATKAERRLREQQMLARLAREFRIEETELRERYGELRRKPQKDSFDRHDTRRVASSPQKHTPVERKAPPLDPWDRELFEIVTQFPELMREAANALRPEDMRTPQARALFDVYLEIFMRGDTPEFGRVLTALDDPATKSLLVALDEAGQAKGLSEPDACLAALIEAYRRRDDEETCRDTVAALEKEDLSEAEQLELLTQLLDQRKRIHQLP
ncbi:MAG: DNA primase [Planctomycetales bacterium]|nr:DNA primase [Planctomycetales bacterium]